MKRTKASNLKAAAQILGKRGGESRSERLTDAQKRKIAAMGGRAKKRKNK